ncbi:MAG: hypothetical protein ABSG68_16915 [Thermoguttaceae bacterium]|jgi:hypothetical protein
MSKHLFLRSTLMPVLPWAAAMTLAALLAVAGTSAGPEPGAAGLVGFSHPDGTQYYALSLKPGVAASSAPRDIVLLVSTAASQIDDVRDRSLAVVKSLTAALAGGDRVKLMAFDLDAVALTKGFVEAGSAELSAALAALQRRSPLGANDMEKALTAAAAGYRGRAAGSRAVIVIGDGTSRANVLSNEQFEKLVATLTGERIPVIQYPVGLHVDGQLVAALAGRTGGFVVEDQLEAKPARTAKGKTIEPAAAGRKTAGQVAGELLAAAHAAVWWPTSARLPAVLGEVYPKTLPPLRGDRSTVLVGTTKAKGPLHLELAVEGPGPARTLSWDFPALKPSEDNNYLVSVVDQARLDDGLTLPIVDELSLDRAKAVIYAGGRNLNRLAREALVRGSLDSAELLVNGALRRDPADPEARAIQGAIAKRRQAASGPSGAPGAEGPPGPAGAAAAPAAPTPALPPAPAAVQPPPPAADNGNDLNLVGGNTVGDGAPPPLPGPGEGAMVESTVNLANLVREQLQKEVQNVVNQARAQMATEPESVPQKLRGEMETIKQAPQLNPEIRDQLMGLLQTALREAARRQTEFEHRRQQRQETIAIQKERELVNDSLKRQQQKLKQLMDRFDSLMMEGKFAVAEEQAAAEAERMFQIYDVRTQPAMLRAATLTSRAEGSLVDELTTRTARQKGFIAMLYQVEKSHVPMPDEPPIVYPDAEVWKELSARRKEKYSAQDLAHRGPEEKKIDEQLKSPTRMDFTDTPLQDAMEWLGDFHGITIQLDKKAMEDVGIGSDTPVNKTLKGISLRSALRLLLRELGLTYVIQDEVLLITTPETAEQKLTTKVYPVADLVLPIRPMSMGSMMGGGMGGMGGGMGGMGGGMGGMGGGMGGMGGGMGGMGGGMGGMGGGMGGMGGMGGGMFDLPPEKVPARLTPQRPATAIDKIEAGKIAVDKIEVEIDADADAVKVWDDYFAAHQPTAAAIREATRRLMKDQQFDHVIALLESAMRHKQAQPWMYEALVLAMQAGNRPKQEIERAVMSAADFADTSTDLMQLGVYLTQLDLHQRALHIFRQVARMEPLSPEPYMYALRAAQKVNDIDGIQWATSGILSQAWPPDQAETWKTALRVARATLEDLRRQKQTKQADRFEATLNEAVARDCVVAVYWTGTADIDLMVEEPSGAVCSLRNWRTTGGGMMVGDLTTPEAAAAGQGHCAAYACPRGFSGNYRLLVRRVWGELTTGKVTVEVITHYLTPNAKRVCNKLSLEKGETLVAFELRDGRRKEPLREQQLANAAAGQLAVNQMVNQQVLAQQVAAAANPAAQAQQAQAAAAAQAAAQGGTVGANGGFIPFIAPFGGAVGYQPVIITLPEGANFGATAVISADRRYVRITCLPLFSGVAKVNTFNTVTGNTQNTPGVGTGGQGFGQLSGLAGNAGSGGIAAGGNAAAGGAGNGIF